MMEVWGRSSGHPQMWLNEIWCFVFWCNSGVWPSGVDGEMSALSFLFKLQSWPDITKKLLVWQVAKGAWWGKFLVDRRSPATFCLLKSVNWSAPRETKQAAYCLKMSWPWHGGRGVKPCSICLEHCYVSFMEVCTLLLHRDVSCKHYQFVSVFKQCLRRMGCAVADYGSHFSGLGWLQKQSDQGWESVGGNPPGSSLICVLIWWKYENTFM